MKNRYIFTITVFFASLFMHGLMQAQQRVSKNEIQTIASNYMALQTNNYEKAKTSEIDTIFEIKHNGVTVIHEVVFKNGNSILLSASKACRPIIGYNLSQKRATISETKELPEGLLCFLNDHEESNAYALSLSAKDTVITNSVYAKEWNSIQTLDASTITKSAKAATSTSSTHGPLITARWDQGESNDTIDIDCNAYNYYVTHTYSGCECESKHCPAGCVPVAMAQIMHYWKYPSLLNLNYDWCNMPDRLISTSPNYTRERNAIARLIKDCGDAINADYCHGKSKCSTGGDSDDARDALVNTFAYHSDADLQNRMWYTDDSWKSKLRTSINNGRPVLYGGYSGILSTTGHQFICDGYKDDGTFHFNWGWGDYKYSEDYWFSIDNLNPGSHNYSSRQDAIFHIYPKGTSVDPCNNSLYLSTYYQFWSSFGLVPYIVPNTFQRIISVPSNYSASWRTIPTGKVGIYEAHKEVILQPGFHAQAGCNFIARITPCSTCPSYRSLEVVPIQQEELLTKTSKPEEVESDTAGFFINHSVKREIVVYPNPNEGCFWVYIRDIQENTVISILSLDGKELYTQKTNQDKTEINISHLPNGTYFITVYDGITKNTFRLIKQ